MLPPCRSHEAKKPGSVFDGTLAIGGNEARLEPPPHLLEFWGPMSQGDAELPDTRSLALARKMHDRNNSQNWSFYVIVYDGTAVQKKTIENDRLKTVN